MTLDNIQYFLAVVEQGSLTHAAQSLAIPKSKLSRRLAQLEKELGTQLLIRTTRSMTLTEPGKLLYQAVKPHLEALSSARALIDKYQATPKGTLKVLLPIEFFSQMFTKLIAKFAKCYPEIDIICHHYNQPCSGRRCEL